MQRDCETTLDESQFSSAISSILHCNVCSQDDSVRTKGQMIHCPESNSLLFVGSPLVDGLDSMTAQGLFLSDIPIHDATRDIILVEEQSKAQEGLKRRMDKVHASCFHAPLNVTQLAFANTRF